MLGVILGVLVFLLVKALRRPKTGIPELPGKWPIIGHGLMFIGDSKYLLNLLKWTGEQSTKQGGVISADFGPTTVYAVANPEDCALVSSQCMEKAFFYDFGKPFLGNALICAKLSQWKQQRKQLNPAFSLQMLNGFIETFNHQARRLVEQLAQYEGQTFDHYHAIVTNNLETSFQTIAGVGIGEMKDTCESYVHSVDKLANIVTQRYSRLWLYNDFIYNFSNLKKQQDECLRVIHGFSEKAIKQRRLQRKLMEAGADVQQDTNSFLDFILEHNEGQNSLTDNEIREHLDIFVMASFDTSATVQVYILTLVGSYPEIQQKLYDEIITEVGHRDVTKIDLPRLVYLEAVIKETLRLYPVAPVVARQADTDLRLKNYTIPKGSSVALLLLSLHQHPMWGPDADQFRPERWLEPTSLPENPNAFAPFSLGRRNCIGKTYAMMSIKTSLVHVLRHYKVTGDISKTEHRVDIMMKPASGHHITLEKRIV